MNIIAPFILTEAKRVLDFCAGWGDCLLGAISVEDQLEYYYGVDPNSQLFEGYQNMISMFSKQPQKFHMVNSPFESCDSFTSFSASSSSSSSACSASPSFSGHAKITFDLVFTGPPYFDYKIYGDGTNQSCTTFPDPVEWIVNFLFYCIHKSWQILNPGGTLALNVNDTYQLVHKRVLYTEAMNLFIQAFFDCTYDGVICFTGANYPAPRPIWLYRKITSQNKAISQQCLLLLQAHYPKIYDKLKQAQWCIHNANNNYTSNNTNTNNNNNNTNKWSS